MGILLGVACQWWAWPEADFCMTRALNEPLYTRIHSSNAQTRFLPLHISPSSIHTVKRPCHNSRHSPFFKHQMHLQTEVCKMTTVEIDFSVVASQLQHDLSRECSPDASPFWCQAKFFFKKIIIPQAFKHYSNPCVLLS